MKSANAENKCVAHQPPWVYHNIGSHKKRQFQNIKNRTKTRNQVTLYLCILIRIQYKII